MKKVRFWGALAIFVVILIRPQQAVTAAQHAMSVWYASVAPTLFPFLVLMPLLTSKEACAAYEAMFSKCMRVVFDLPGAAAPAVVIGMIAGSPAGAIALRHTVANFNIKPCEARRISMAMAGVSPAYLIIGVGQVLCGSISLGVKLAGIQICIQILLLIMLTRRKQEEREIIWGGDTEKNTNAISMALQSLLSICGYMVFFSIVASMIASFVGEKAGIFMLLAMDLPSGLANLMNSDIPGKMLLLGASVGFGGICIGYQNMDIHKDIGLQWKDYIKGRAIAALMFGCACMGLERLTHEDTQILFDNIMKNYSLALLLAGFMVLPGLYFLSRKWFLNK